MAAAVDAATSIYGGPVLQATLRAARDLNSPFMRKVYAVMESGRAARREAQAKARDMVVPYCLDAAQSSLLSAWYPEWSVRTCYAQYSSAPVYETNHFLAYERMMHMDRWMGDSVVAFDAPIDVQVAKCRDYVLVAKTMATVVHELQYQEELKRVANIASGTSPAATLARMVVEADPTQNRFYTLDAASAQRQAETLVFDVTTTPTCLAQVAFAMQRWQSVRAMVMLPYTNEFLTQPRGDLTHGLGEFVVDKEADTITIVPAADPLRAVAVSYRAVRQFAELTVFRSDGNLYHVERVGHGNGYLFVRVVKLDSEECGETYEFHKLWNDESATMVELEYFVYDSSLGDVSEEKAWVPRTVRGPEVVYNKLYSKACDLPEGDFDDTELYRILRNVNNNAVGAGCSFKLVERFSDPMVAMAFVAGVYRKAYVDRHDHAQGARVALDAVRVRSALETQGLRWASVAAYAAARAALGAAFHTVSRRVLEAAFGQYVDGGKFEVKVTKVPPYVEVDGVVGPKLAPTLKIKDWAGQFHPCLPGGPVAQAALVVADEVESTEAVVAAVARARASQSQPSYGPAETVVSTNRLGLGLGLGVKVDKLSAMRDAVRVKADTVERRERPTLAGDQKLVAERLRTPFELGVDDPVVLPKVELEEDVGGTRTKVSVTPVVDPVAGINEYLQAQNPGVSEVEPDAATAAVHDEDFILDTNAPELQLNMSKDEGLRPKRLRPSNIRSDVGMPHPQTLREALYSSNKRTFDVPQFGGNVDVEKTARDAFSACARAFFLPGWQDQLRVFQETPILPAEGTQADWIGKATSDTLRKLLTCDLNNADMVLDVYEMMIKAAGKPKLDGSAMVEYGAVQTIVYHRKQVNAYFSPLFIEASRRLDSLLDPRVVMNVRKDIRDIQRRVSKAYRAARAAGLSMDATLKFLENDFGKFDKSQLAVCWAIEKEFYAQLGMPSWLLDDWMEANLEGEVRSVSAGLRFWVSMQRKSGTATTSLGNTIVNMATVAFAYGLDSGNIVYAVFLGDDSLVRVKRPINEGEATVVMAQTFNLSAKCGLSEYGYCCSAWYLEIEDEVVVMSDAGKRAVSLGKPASCDDGVVKENWVSFADLCYNYNDQVALEMQAAAIAARRPCGINPLHMVECVATLALDTTGKHRDRVYGTPRYMGRG